MNWSSTITTWILIFLPFFNSVHPQINLNVSEEFEKFGDSESWKNSRIRDRRQSKASIPAELGTCPPGYRIHQNECFPCFPGSYTSGQEFDCYLCPKDFYMTKEAADSCWPCPEGRKTLAPGADSEELCIYIDKQGHPVSGRDTKWMVIIACIIIFFICLWLIILLLLWRMGVTFRWRTKQLDSPEAEVGEITDQPPPNEYETDEEPIYEEIREEDLYEEPRRPSEKPMYVELIPEENYYEEIDEEDYEIPLPAKNKTSLSGHYESPIYDEPNDNYEEVNNKTPEEANENDVSGRKSKEIFANTVIYPQKNKIHQKTIMGSQPSTDAIKSQYRSDSEVLIDIIERASKGEFDSSQAGSLVQDLEDEDIEKLICKTESQSMSEFGTTEKRSDEHVQQTPIPSSNVHSKSIQRKVKSDAYVNQLTKHRMKQWSDDYIKSPSEVISSKYQRYSQGQNLPVNEQVNELLPTRH